MTKPPAPSSVISRIAKDLLWRKTKTALGNKPVLTPLAARTMGEAGHLGQSRDPSLTQAPHR